MHVADTVLTKYRSRQGWRMTEQRGKVRSAIFLISMVISIHSRIKASRVDDVGVRGKYMKMITPFQLQRRRHISQDF